MSTNTLYKIDVPLKMGKLQPIIDWCEQNCQGDWKFRSSDIGSMMDPGWRFEFELEQDYLLFVLTWK